MLKNIFFAILIGFAAFQLKSILFNKSQTMEPNQLNASYHYIIIGAGSAGSVLASRLSEDPTKNVLLLEAGGEEYNPWYSHIPAAGQYLAGTVFDWGYKTVPQTHGCNAMENRQSYWPRGKGLGGSSVLNWMVYLRGNPADFDRWEELGNSGWSYKDVLPYFMRSETTEVKHLKNSPVHGHDGPLHISEGPKTMMGDIFFDAIKEMGIEAGTDGCGIQTNSFARLQFFNYKGVRESVVRRYLRPAMSRPNLHVVTHAHVTKILFKKEQQYTIAQGVQFHHSGKYYTVATDKEIILSGGTINSPQVLMLSGVGPAEHLKEHGIPLVLDSPAVGKYLDDHLAVQLYYSINVTEATIYDNVFDIKNLIKSVPQYFIFKTGPFSTMPMEINGFFNNDLMTKHKGPALQLYMLPGISAPDPVRYCKYKPEVADVFDLQQKSRSYLTLAPVLLHPHSLGEILLKSNDPFDYPLINPKYFHNDIDTKVLLAGLKMLIKIMKTKSMAKYDPQLMEKPMPGCDHLKFFSDDYLLCISKHRAFTTYHHIGTCRMGQNISNSVVDENLKVHGIIGLRVVDASIFPEDTSGNTNAPTIMVAEKAADLIKRDF